MAEAKIYVPPTEAKAPARTYNQIHSAAKAHARRQAAGQHLCVLELSRRSQPRTSRSWTTASRHDRSPPRRVALLGGAGVVGPDDVPAGNRRRARAVLSRMDAVPAARHRGHRPRGAGVPARRSGRLPASTRRARPRRRRHAAGVRARSPVDGTGSVSRRDRGGETMARAAKATCSFLDRTTTSASPPTSTNGPWSTRTTATCWFHASSASASTRAR